MSYLLLFYLFLVYDGMIVCTVAIDVIGFCPLFGVNLGKGSFVEYLPVCIVFHPESFFLFFMMGARW